MCKVCVNACEDAINNACRVREGECGEMMKQEGGNACEMFGKE